MKALVRSYVWWPKMDAELQQKVRQCSPCKQNWESPPEAPFHPWEWPHKPWVRLHLKKSRTAYATHGLPEIIVTDNESNFTSEEFEPLLKQNRIRHIRTATYHPASVGLTERAVQLFREGLKKMNGGSVVTQGSRFLARYRIIPPAWTGVSPAELFLVRKPSRDYT